MVWPAIPATLHKVLKPLIWVLENKYFFDWFNENVLARGARLLGTGFWKIGDIKIIDGFIVNGSWKLVGWIASGVRRLQTGYLYHYALVMAAGVLLLLSYFVTWPMLEPIVSKWLGH